MSFIKNYKQRLLRSLRIEIDHLPNNGDFVLPNEFWPFVWFFLKQIKGVLLLIGSAAAIEALSISYTYWFIGRIVEQQAFNFTLLMLGVFIVAVTPFASNFLQFCKNALYVPFFGNMVRRQCFHYVSRQSLSYFQNDFSGRIANKLLQCSSALRDATLSIIASLISVGTLLLTNILLMLNFDPKLALPQVLWVILYIGVLAYFLPVIKRRSSIAAESMSTLTGQVVDSFTNILPAKYFARIKQEDDRATYFLKDYGRTMAHALKKSTQQNIALGIINFLLVASTMFVGYSMIVSQQAGALSALVMALPMVIQTTFWSGRIMDEMVRIFENFGTIQEGVNTLSRPLGITDKPDAHELVITNNKADITFKNVTFSYNPDNRAILKDFNLNIDAGQKVGLVGRSGAGKSTITSLIVRAYDVNNGEIFIGGQNIADVTQTSLRENITVVTQDNYLFHRSVLDNIRYGKPEASVNEVIDAARRAHAHDFIEDLVDNQGRKAYEAYVGERGVKLSGGQKQRIDIARAILKDAPILILDEPTSALDSESEQAIQKGLESIMEGRTVIAIAHRLSTLRQMDRIIVIEEGKIIEDGAHDTLIKQQDSYYARLWKMQSAGFIGDINQDVF